MPVEQASIAFGRQRSRSSAHIARAHADPLGNLR